MGRGKKAVSILTSRPPHLKKRSKSVECSDFLNAGTVAAVTVFSGRKFHMFTIRCAKENFLMSLLEYFFFAFMKIFQDNLISRFGFFCWIRVRQCRFVRIHDNFDFDCSVSLKNI